MKHTVNWSNRAQPKSAGASAASGASAPARKNPLATRLAPGRHFLTPLLILFWFIFYQNTPDTINGYDFKPLNTQGAIDRSAKIIMILFGLIIMGSQWRTARQLFKNLNPGMIAFMVLIPMSSVWSMDPSATLLRYTTLLSMVILCMVIPMAGWDRFRFQQVTLPPVMTILVISLICGMIAPDMVKEIGTDISLNNSWKGITHQKNGFGAMASIVTIFCVHRFLSPRKHTTGTIVGIVIALTCLLLSRSSTSLLSMLLSVAFMVAALRIPIIKERFTTLMVIGIFALILVYALAVQNLIPGVYTLLAPVMHLTGKDMTFSARSIIWDAIKERMQAAPWLGTGYAAYWTGPNPGAPAYEFFMQLMYFYPTQSHNGYLEIMNDLGRVGLICLLIFLIYFVRQALKLMSFDRSQAVLYLAILFQQMVDNLSESEWFSRTTTCAIMLLCCACLSRALVEYQQRMQSSA